MIYHAFLGLILLHSHTIGEDHPHIALAVIILTLIIWGLYLRMKSEEHLVNSKLISSFLGATLEEKEVELEDFGTIKLLPSHFYLSIQGPITIEELSPDELLHFVLSIDANNPTHQAFVRKHLERLYTRTLGALLQKEVLDLEGLVVNHYKKLNTLNFIEMVNDDNRLLDLLRTIHAFQNTRTWSAFKFLLFKNQRFQVEDTDPPEVLEFQKCLKATGFYDHRRLILSLIKDPQKRTLAEILE